jgi:hypothetical protein
MSTSFFDLPIATIEKALGIRKEIEALQASVNELLGGVKESASPASVTVSPKRVDGRKGKRSPAARAKMAAAQKARWAKKNVATAPIESQVKAPKKKRTMSPEGRARIVAALKARWAKKRGDSAPASAKSEEKASKKRKAMSPEARARIAAAQRARWAKQKAA